MTISAKKIGSPSGALPGGTHGPAVEQQAAIDFAFGHSGFTAWREVEIDARHWERIAKAQEKRKRRPVAVRFVRQSWATMAVLPQMLRSAVAGFSR